MIACLRDRAVLSGFECGKCKKAFPQHIPGREKLIEVREF